MIIILYECFERKKNRKRSETAICHFSATKNNTNERRLTYFVEKNK